MNKRVGNVKAEPYMLVLVALNGKSVPEKQSAVGIAAVTEVNLVGRKVLIAMACEEKEVVVGFFLRSGKIDDSILKDRLLTLFSFFFLFLFLNLRRCLISKSLSTPLIIVLGNVRCIVQNPFLNGL
jgi:hypothetical protein